MQELLSSKHKRNWSDKVSRDLTLGEVEIAKAACLRIATEMGADPSQMVQFWNPERISDIEETNWNFTRLIGRLTYKSRSNVELRYMALLQDNYEQAADGVNGGTERFVAMAKETLGDDSRYLDIFRFRIEPSGEIEVERWSQLSQERRESHIDVTPGPGYLHNIARYKTRNGSDVRAYEYRGLARTGNDPWGMDMDWVDPDNVRVFTAFIPSGWWLGNHSLSCLNETVNDDHRLLFGAELQENEPVKPFAMMDTLSEAVSTVPLTIAVQKGFVKILRTSELGFFTVQDVSDEAVYGERWIHLPEGVDRNAWR